jgi:integrase/recombinase XerD
LEPYIRAFLAYLRGEKGLAANTIAAYRRDMEKFGAFMTNSNRTLENLTHSDVVDFLRTLYHRGLDTW